ncbi:hypothetical protein BC629DRAFT_1037886 [Irpex lacteus]|nr:hypothetical protein BC629DRAFT_1037886 [Irpex lacteus]
MDVTRRAGAASGMSWRVARTRVKRETERRSLERKKKSAGTERGLLITKHYTTNSRSPAPPAVSLIFTRSSCTLTLLTCSTLCSLSSGSCSSTDASSSSSCARPDHRDSAEAMQSILVAVRQRGCTTPPGSGAIPDSSWPPRDSSPVGTHFEAGIGSCC